jgi:hypothetical protein
MIYSLYGLHRDRLKLFNSRAIPIKYYARFFTGATDIEDFFQKN